VVARRFCLTDNPRMKLTPAQLKKMMPLLDERQRAVLAAQGVDAAGRVKTERRAQADTRVRSPLPLNEETHEWKIEIPVKLLSESNTRGKWQQIGRAKKQKTLVRDYLSVHGIRPVNLESSVIHIDMLNLFRMSVAPDEQNVPGRFKAVQDALVAWLGFDDRPHPNLSIVYRVGRHPAGEHSLVLTFKCMRKTR
jgi:hypothetical protein